MRECRITRQLFLVMPAKNRMMMPMSDQTSVRSRLMSPTVRPMAGS